MSSRRISETITKTSTPTESLNRYSVGGSSPTTGNPGFISGATAMMLDQWQDVARRDQPLDVAAEMLRLTLHIVSQALFNSDLSDETPIAGQAVTTVNKLLSDYIYAPFPPLSVPTSRNRRLQVACRTLDQVVHGIITQRRQQNMDTGDLLSMLLLARDEETGHGMNDQHVRDEVITLLIAGHETVSTALTWTWYLLSQHPEVERRLLSELDEVLGGQVPTVGHLAQLSYTQMVLEEALRLYPPAWVFGRKAIADGEIGGYVIPANSMIVLSPYLTHRHTEELSKLNHQDAEFQRGFAECVKHSTNASLAGRIV